MELFILNYITNQIWEFTGFSGYTADDGNGLHFMLYKKRETKLKYETKL